jgi:hypothetical protein
MRPLAFRITQRREPLEAAPLASMAPVTPRFGERPTVASVVRRHLQRARSAAAGRGDSGRATVALLPCGHPADQPHDRFHPFHHLRGPAMARVGLVRGGLARGF